MSSVVVKSIDEAAVRRAMDAYAQRLFATRTDVAEIVVFGSFATGTWAPGSDLDVLIVLRDAAERVRDRIPSLLPGRFPVPVDLFPFTRDELTARADSPVAAAARASTWRYSRPSNVADTERALAREQMRQWLANWRAVNEAQDNLVRSDPAPDPASALERGLSLIEFALPVRAPLPEGDRSHDLEDESVRHTWRQLRLSYGR